MKNFMMKCLASASLVLFVAGYMMAQNSKIGYYRPYDRTGINMFETPQMDNYEFTGLKVKVGGSFTQQMQILDNENDPYVVDGEVVNPIQELDMGFNLATANLNIDAQFAPGVRLNLETYLSSRHHAESWVKGGYIQFDELPFLNSEFFDNLMDNFTIKVGHMEINYGDNHFRRTDNGNAMYNPFVGNYILDAFNTEIGAEIYFKKDALMLMGGITGGEINGNVSPGRTSADGTDKRSPSLILKAAFDDQVSEDLRVRISGSMYTTASSSANHLYDGDRGGSRYYSVLSAPGARAGDDFRTGRYNPDFSDELTSFQFNGFLKFSGLEFYAVYEMGKGRDHAETDDQKRDVSQIGAELLYRFGATENFYIGGRYNTITADDPSGNEITINRIQGGFGWFLIDNVLMKIEYVNQEYKDFPVESQFAGGKFNGLMVEAVVGF